MGRVYRVGYLTSSAPDSPLAAEGFQAFRQRLETLGYSEGENLAIEYRSSDGKEDRFPGLAAELVGLHVDVIMVGDSRAIPIAKAATTTVPIVMVNGGNVVAQGLVASLAHPGGNLTGMTDLSESLNQKRLELLKRSSPGVSRVAILWNGGNPELALAWDGLHAAAQSLEIELVSLDVQSGDELDRAFEAARSQRADALCVLPDPLTNINAQRITELAAQHQWPAIYGTKPFVDKGGLMSYGPNRAAMFRGAADYVDKILKGARPADLPVEQPTRFDFVVNLKAAEGLGISLPQQVLVQATELRY